MESLQQKLESLFNKLRSMPKDRQEAAVEALSDIAEETYTLSTDELRLLRPALDRAQRGEFADDAIVDEVLNKPWR